jgi:hypothetical protein
MARESRTSPARYGTGSGDGRRVAAVLLTAPPGPVSRAWLEKAVWSRAGGVTKSRKGNLRQILKDLEQAGLLRRHCDGPDGHAAEDGQVSGASVLIIDPVALAAYAGGDDPIPPARPNRPTSAAASTLRVAADPAIEQAKRWLAEDLADNDLAEDIACWVAGIWDVRDHGPDRWRPPPRPAPNCALCLSTPAATTPSVWLVACGSEIGCACPAAMLVRWPPAPACAAAAPHPPRAEDLRSPTAATDPGACRHW